MCCIFILLIHRLFWFFGNRSSYPDRKEGEDAEMDDEELPDDKTLEYDDETLELTLPSGDMKCVITISKIQKLNIP